MAKQESTQQLVNQLEDAVKTSQELLKQYNTLSKLISQTATDLKEGFGAIDKNTTKGLAEFNKLLAQTNKLLAEEEKNNQEKEKTEREIIKNQQELSKLKKIQIQEQQAELRLKKQIQKEEEAQAKAQAKQAKIDAQENSAYAKKSKRLNELRKQYKDLASEQKENGKEAKKLLKEITKLDKELKNIDETVGQNQRSVGDYAKAMKGLNNTIGKLGITALVVKGIELLTSAFGDSRNGAESLDRAMVRVNATLQVLGQRFGAIGSAIVEIFSSSGDGWVDQIQAVGKAFKAFATGWEGFGEQVSQTIDRMDRLVSVSTSYKIELEALERTISRLKGTYLVYLQIAENDTLSFERREKASKDAEKALLELNKKEKEAARLRLQLATEEIGIKIQVDQKRGESTEAYAERVKKALKDEETAKKISQEDDEAFTAAVVENNDTRAESTERYGDFLEKQAKLYSDWAEVNLTIDTDLYEAQKELNVKRIEDEREAFSDREEMLRKEEETQEKFFQRRIQLIVDQRKKTLENEKKLGQITEEQYQQELKTLDVQTLLNIANEENVELQAEMIKNLKLGEKFTEIYVREVKDNKKATDELNESQKAINESYSEYENILADIALMEKKAADSTFDLEKARREQRKTEIRAEMDKVATDSVEFAKLEQELVGIILDENLNAQEEALKKRQELFQASISAIENTFDKVNEKRNKEIEERLKKNQERIDQISKAAEMGNEAAKESLAAEERKQAELERKKEQQRKREQRQEMLIAGLNLLAENADQPNALGKSISDVTAMIGIISSLPTYLKGTEDTGNGGNLDNNGGFLSVLHPNERVMTKEQNKALGGLTNDEVAELGKMHNMGAFEYSPVVVENNEILKKEVQSMRKSIETLHERIPIQRVDYDAKAKEHVHTIESNNKTEKLRTKAKNVWR